MSKAYFFAIFLLAASFIGCLGDDELDLVETEEEEIEEEETIEPVREGNVSSLEKRISDLEAKIAEYEMPKVYFFNMIENNYSHVGFSTYEIHRSDDGYLFCYYFEYYDRNVCYLNARFHDANGMIESYSWEGSEVEIENGGLCQENTDPLICLNNAGIGGIQLDVCSLAAVNQTLTLTIYDNDGNEASASYEFDYFTNCGQTYETDQIPEISFHVEEGNGNKSGIYYVDVISVSEEYHLENYNFFLKNSTGSTYVGGNGFGEIAMTSDCEGDCWAIVGIEETYDGGDSWKMMRANNMTNDDGSEFPVHFFDNDGDDMLSAGDQFIVYGTGNSTNGPAEDDWTLEIQFFISGDVVGTTRLS